MNVRVAIVGPTKAGKTVYLASLLRAGFVRGRTAKPIKVRADPDNASAVALERRASAVMRGETFEATTTVAQLELLADLPGSRLFGLGRETLRVTMADVPGGDCMPAVQGRVHPAVLQSVAAADALMIVVPADGEARPADFCARLAHLLATATAQEPRRYGAHHFLRVAVVMTMAELLVADKSTRALATLETLDPQQEIVAACGRELLPIVRRVAPAGGDWFALVSAFGFDVDTGQLASTRTSSGWRVTTDNAGFRDNWRPYRVFEPLEFLGRGVCWRGDL